MSTTLELASSSIASTRKLAIAGVNNAKMELFNDKDADFDKATEYYENIYAIEKKITELQAKSMMPSNKKVNTETSERLTKLREQFKEGAYNREELKEYASLTAAIYNEIDSINNTKMESENSVNDLAKEHKLIAKIPAKTKRIVPVKPKPTESPRDDKQQKLKLKTGKAKATKDVKAKVTKTTVGKGAPPMPGSLKLRKPLRIKGLKPKFPRSRKLTDIIGKLPEVKLVNKYYELNDAKVIVDLYLLLKHLHDSDTKIIINERNIAELVNTHSDFNEDQKAQLMQMYTDNMRELKKFDDVAVADES